MKKLLLLTLLYLCAVPIWAQTGTGVLTSGTNGTTNTGTTVSVDYAYDAVNHVLALSNFKKISSTSTSLNWDWAQPDYPCNFQITFDEGSTTQGRAVAVAGQPADSGGKNVYSTNKDSNTEIAATFVNEGEKCKITFPSNWGVRKPGAVSFLNSLDPQYYNSTMEIDGFTIPVFSGGQPDPEISIKSIDYDNKDSFVVEVKAANMKESEYGKIKVFYKFSNETEQGYKEAISSEKELTYTFSLTNLTSGESYTLDVYASYEDIKSDVKDFEFTAPLAIGSGEMTWNETTKDGKPGNCSVTAVYTTDKNLEITNFASLPESLIFKVDESGKCKVDGKPYTGATFGEGTRLMYTDITGSGSITGTIVNTSEDSSKLTVDDWAQSIPPSPKETYYNTEIIFNFAIPGLPIQEPEVTISIGEIEISEVTSNSATITVSDVKYTGVEADEVTVWVNVAAAEGEKDKFQDAILLGDTATLTVYELAANTEYTVTVYAEAGETDKVKTTEISDTFTTLPEPKSITVGNVTASEVNSTSAKISFSVTTNGWDVDPELTFNYILKANGQDVEAQVSDEDHENSSYFAYLSDLTPGTEYTITVYAEAEEDGIVSNEDQSVTFTTPALPVTLSIKKLEVVNVTGDTADIEYELEAPNAPANATYAINAKIPGYTKYIGENEGAEGTFTLDFGYGDAFDVTFNATVSVGSNVLATATQAMEVVTHYVIVGQPKVTCEVDNNTVTATVEGKVDENEEAWAYVGNFSDYQIRYTINPSVGEPSTRTAQLDAEGNYSFIIEGLSPNTNYTIDITPYTASSKACGVKETASFKTPEVPQTPVGPVNASGTMVYDGGQYNVTATYNAETQKLVLTGVGGSANRLTLNVKADGSLESERREVYGYDIEDDEDYGVETYDIYFADNVNGSPSSNYIVTGTAVNSGKNCVLTLGNIGAYSTYYGSFNSRKWDNTVITLTDLTLNIETAPAVPSISITDVNMKETVSGYDFTVTVTAENITEAIEVSYKVDPEIENPSAVTKNEDGTYTFTIASESLTEGTEYTVTVSASAGDVKAEDVKVEFTASEASEIETVTLKGNYTRLTSSNGYFTFDATEPFGTKFSLVYYVPNNSTGEYQKLGLYGTNVYTSLESGRYGFVVAGSIDDDGVVKPITPANTISTDKNQMVFDYGTGLFKEGLYEKSGNTNQLMPNAVICVVECTTGVHPENGSPIYPVEEVKKVYRFLGGRFGDSLTEKTEFPAAGMYEAIGFVNGGEYSWTLQLQEIKDFHYGDIQTSVESIEAADADARYFTLQGVEIRNPQAGTICIKVSGNKATKVVIR